MKRNRSVAMQVAAAAVLASTLGGASAAWAAGNEYQRVDQGKNWTAAEWNAFYTLDQGSRIMPLTWMQALKQANGQPFLADSLTRYGYLPNPNSPTPGLPVGFTTNDFGGETAIGMTCAACHTRELSANGVSYRVDGGPALTDFYGFMVDVDASVARVLASDAAFAPFAVAVLGGQPKPADVAALKVSVKDWYTRYHTLVDLGLPKSTWGVGRLDAVGMIFNRLTGLDIGKKKDNYLIPENIQRAEAPVRYPFLWNAAIQDMTQWPEFSANGSPLLGLSRNLGEVLGVFGEFHPKSYIVVVDYLSQNSANFEGLTGLESLISPDKLGAPKWPWTLDAKLADKGKEVFNRPAGSGGCVECHGETPGKTRFPDHKTWATPLVDVGTDSREYGELGWVAKTGVLEGARKPLSLESYGACDTAFNLLSYTVIGAIIEKGLQEITSGGEEAASVENKLLSYADKLAQMDGKAASLLSDKATQLLTQPKYKDLKDAFTKRQGHSTTAQPCQAASTDSATTTSYAYESRVMYGIWAAAPYLHNASVPTLWDLLQPVQDRPASFPVGNDYDPVKAGLAATQSRFNYTQKTTDCSQRDSGDSRCGHEFGTSLPVDEKKALLEYLKSL